MVFVMGASALHAEPEVITIKRPDKKMKEQVAVSQIKNINIQDIEDPAARKAIEQIFNYLGLEAKK